MQFVLSEVPELLTFVRMSVSADHPISVPVALQLPILRALILIFTVEVSTNLEQHLCREEQHHCVPGTRGYPLLLHQQV